MKNNEIKLYSESLIFRARDLIRKQNQIKQQNKSTEKKPEYRYIGSETKYSVGDIHKQSRTRDYSTILDAAFSIVEFKCSKDYCSNGYISINKPDGLNKIVYIYKIDNIQSEKILEVVFAGTCKECIDKYNIKIKTENKIDKQSREKILSLAISKCKSVLKITEQKLGYENYDTGIGIYFLKSLKEDEYFEDDYNDFVSGESDEIAIGNWDCADADNIVKGKDIFAWNKNVQEIFTALEKIKEKEYHIELDGSSTRDGQILLILN